MNRAIFLDRDGVLDELVYYADTDGWGAPREPEDLRLRPHVRQSLGLAASHGWLTFVVSNQPDAAKGKTTRQSLDAVHEKLVEQLGEGRITEFFYCYHRAEDACACRKPKPFLVLEAAKKYDIDLRQSWFVGDVDTDIECGRRGGCRTALIEYPHSRSRRGAQQADLVCRDLGHFVRTLVGRTSDHGVQPQD